MQKLLKRRKKVTKKTKAVAPKAVKRPSRNNRQRPIVAAESKRPFMDTYDLPAGYNTTNITLIPRDPSWVYAYWEISPSSIETMRKQIGWEFDRSVHTLRMYDVSLRDFNGENANSWFDIDVGPFANNWHINLWTDNVTYCGEIGIRTPDGRFFAFARSNFITTPRKGSSGRTDLMWMEVREEQRHDPYVIADVKRAESRPSQAAMSKSGAAVKGPGRKIFLTEHDIRAYYSRLFPLLKDVLSTRLTPKLGKDIYDREYSIDIGDDVIHLEKFLLRGLKKGEFLKKILLGASEEMVLLGGASEQLLAQKKEGASERKAKQRKFFFEIGTELIVYGRTEPDAEVWLGDKKVALREDGTFTLRFALPDGEIPLAFIAKSSNKTDKRRITSSVKRTKTKYDS